MLPFHLLIDTLPLLIVTFVVGLHTVAWLAKEDALRLRAGRNDALLAAGATYLFTKSFSIRGPHLYPKSERALPPQMG